MKASALIRVLGLSALMIAALWLTPSLAKASDDYDRGFEAGKQAAMEKLAQTGGKSLTNPIAVLASYLGIHERDAKKCVDQGECDEYQKGFLCGYCQTMTKEHRECFKSLSGCQRMSLGSGAPF